MLKKLKVILEIQELDIKMIRLMRIKKQRQKELEHVDALRQELKNQLVEKEKEIDILEKTIFFNETKIQEAKEKSKKLEQKQSSVKKVDEFNALTQEITSAEREKIATEQATSDLIDKKNMEEEILTKIRQSLAATEESSTNLEKEIQANINEVNLEGQALLKQRNALVQNADSEIFKIYEKLLKNKKDRVVVPIENRTCSGCHIALTAQHENLARKAERLVFCEHCSRIIYWQEREEVEAPEGTTKKRRRRTLSSQA